LSRPSGSLNNTLLCVAVSVSEDAAGLYFRYQFNLGNATAGLTNLQLATWPSSNSYILTADALPAKGQQGNAHGAYVIALDRANMLQGQLADARYGRLTNAAYHGCLATDLDGFNVSAQRAAGQRVRTRQITE